MGMYEIDLIKFYLIFGFEKVNITAIRKMLPEYNSFYMETDYFNNNFNVGENIKKAIQPKNVDIFKVRYWLNKKAIEYLNKRYIIMEKDMARCSSILLEDDVADLEMIK